MATHDFTPGNDMGGVIARIKAISEDHVHKTNEHEGPFSLHVVGVGGTGAAVIEQLLTDAPAGINRMTALAVDIGDADLAPVRAAADGSAAAVNTVALPVPPRDELLGSLRRYREYLKMEYPRYYWNPNYEPWLPSDVEIPAAGESFPRAIAKAIYGSEYYQGGEIASALDTFAAGVDDGETTPIVVVVFSLGGGTGSSIVPDLARHLSSIKLGRRPWVVGIGVLPTAADGEATADGRFFPAINEFDCMIDTEKDQGVMAVWGDLYRNPFTGGFFAVTQDDAVEAAGGDLGAAHKLIDRGIAEFLGRDGSTHLYETLKGVNWLSVAGAAWHPAIRSQPSDRWINLLSVASNSTTAPLATVIEGTPTTDYVEIRSFAGDQAAAQNTGETIAATVNSAVEAAVPAGVMAYTGTGDELTFVVVPRLTKLDLTEFIASRNAYDERTWDEKLYMHSFLLDLGVMLCEPSIRFDGLGGECIWGCACWVVIPHAAIRGEAAPAVAA